jgi:hypothetical protein
MRTTLTIDADVAAQIERLRREGGRTLKGVINDALRRGLHDMQIRPKPRKPFRTQVYDMGPSLVNIDNVAGTIAHTEGEDFRRS